MSPKPFAAPALTPTEHTDRAIERSPVASRNLECASMDVITQELVVWNGDGDPVVVVKADQDALVSLMMKGKLNVEHFTTLVDAMEHNVSHFGPLLDLFRQLVGFLPPEEYGRAKERLSVMWEQSVVPPVKNAARLMKGRVVRSATIAMTTISAMSVSGAQW